jgi:hypothetical protein
MWHPSTTNTNTYPSDHSAADRTDVLHGKQYKREDRELIPELVAIHLESEDANMGANWFGRTTVKFSHKSGPSTATTKTAQAAKWLRKMCLPKNSY